MDVPKWRSVEAELRSAHSQTESNFKANFCRLKSTLPTEIWGDTWLFNFILRLVFVAVFMLVVYLKVYCYQPTLNFNTKSYLILISSDILELKKGLKKMFTQETNCPSDKKNRRLGRGCAKGTFDFFHGPTFKFPPFICLLKWIFLDFKV